MSQADAIKDVFRKFDINGDGVIDRGEFSQIVQNLDPSWTSTKVDSLLKAMDSNNDNLVQYDEFVDWIFEPASACLTLQCDVQDVIEEIAPGTLPFKYPRRRVSTFGGDSLEILVNVTNDLDFAVRVSWVNYEGDIPAHGFALQIAQGDSWSQKTFTTHPWCFFHNDSADELTCVCFTKPGPIPLSSIIKTTPEAPLFEVPRERKSGYDKNGDVLIRVQNDTSFRVCFEWVDYQGEFRQVAQCDPGQNFNQNTNSQHPWRLTNAQDRKEVACVLFRTCADSVSVRVSDMIQLCAEPLARPGGSTSRARQVERRQRTRCAGACRERTGESASLPWSPKAQVEGCGKVYELLEVDGFTLFIERGALESCSALRATIAADVAEVVRVLPAAALALVQQKAAIWVNTSFKYAHEPSAARGMCCHWSASWLVSHGNMAEKEGCLECYAAQDWVDWRSTQPAMLLHELCHAFHKHSSANVNRIIIETFNQCMESGLYDRGEYMGSAIPPSATWAAGQGASSKPYAAGNASEFFAETCEAFFSSSQFRNDFFPYVHAELKGFDPTAYRMCEQVFGISGDELSTRAEFPSDWARRFAKLNEGELCRAFHVGDENKDGVLELQEFVQALEAFGIEGLTRDEAMAALKYSDANKDGVVSFPEFQVWMANLRGAHVKS